MDALSIIGEDSMETAKQRAAPHPYLRQLLMLPPEDPFVACVDLQRKSGGLEEELEHAEDEEDLEPIRVKSIGSGAFLAWNQAHPDEAIRVGDHIAKVNEAEDKSAILEELSHARGFKRYKLNITFMRAVHVRDYGIQEEHLQRMQQEGEPQECQESTEEILLKENDKLRRRLNQSQVKALKIASTRRAALIQALNGQDPVVT
jgi:hypothetical protein